MTLVAQFQILLQIAFAGFLGGIVGFEREFAEKPAGLRTHMLVATASALLMIAAGQAISELYPSTVVSADPVRAIQAIVVGVSFLGAGTILKTVRDEERYIEGLTTGASILMVSVLGIVVALEAYVLAFGAALFNVAVNIGISHLTEYVKGRSP